MIEKEKVEKTLKQMPDEFSVDELLDRLHVLQKIDRGIKASEKGEIYTVEEAKENVGKWLD